jgi:uncharacterized protein YkwD
MDTLTQLLDISFKIFQSIVLSLILSQSQLPHPYTPQTNSSTASATLSAQPNQHTPTPKPTSTTKPKPTATPVENYQLEPDPDGKEGQYIIKNAPSETMATVEELNQATNQYRQTHGHNQLHIDSQLCDIANSRAIEIDEEFSHQKFQEHFDNGDYNYTGVQAMGENLWQGSFSAVHIVEFGWDKSPGHQANQRGDWTKGCAGIYKTNAVFIHAR